MAVFTDIFCWCPARGWRWVPWCPSADWGVLRSQAAPALLGNLAPSLYRCQEASRPVYQNWCGHQASLKLALLGSSQAIVFRASALWADAFYKSKCPSVCPSVCPSDRVVTFEVSLKRIFAPTSQSGMSKNFRDSEFMGKSSEKKWSQILISLLKNGPKLPRQKQICTDFVFFICSLHLTSFCHHFPNSNVQTS